MNAVGRQRSGALAVHQQRHYSDHFQETSVNDRLSQSASLQHPLSSSNAVPPVQDFGFYSGRGDGSRMYRSSQTQRTDSGCGSDLFVEEQVSRNEYSPGLLDLHSFDTELIPEEMNLLVEADQPGNQLDGYISRLSSILSRKAAGILHLQNHLAHFQQHLKEHNVLVSSGY